MYVYIYITYITYGCEKHLTMNGVVRPHHRNRWTFGDLFDPSGRGCSSYNYSRSKELWERCNLSSLKRLKMAENGIKWSVHGLTCLTWPFHQHIPQDWTLCLLRPLSIAVWNPAGALSLADIRRRSCRSQRLRGWEWCNLKMNLYESMNQLENMEKLIAYP